MKRITNHPRNLISCFGAVFLLLNIICFTDQAAAQGCSVSITGPTYVCLGDTVEYSTSYQSGDSLVWGINSGSIISYSSNRDTVYVVVYDSSGLITAKRVNASCTDSTAKLVHTRWVWGSDIVRSDSYLSRDDYACFGQMVQYEVDHMDTAKYTYNWSVINGTITQIGNDQKVTIAWGNDTFGIIKVTIWDGFCEHERTRVVHIRPSPSFTLNGTTVCKGTSIIYEVPQQYQTSQYTYLWWRMNSTSTDSFGLDTALVSIKPGTYKDFGVRIIDTYTGCEGEDTFYIDVDSTSCQCGGSGLPAGPLPGLPDTFKRSCLTFPYTHYFPDSLVRITAPSDSIYYRDSLLTAADSFYWDIDNLFFSTQKSPVLSLNNKGVHVAELHVFLDGCSRVYTSVIHLSDVDIPPSQYYVDTICLGETAQLIGPSGSSVHYWYNPDGGIGTNDTLSSTLVVTPFESTTYFVIVQNSDGCFYTDSVGVYIDPTCPCSDSTLAYTIPGMPDTVVVNCVRVPYMRTFGDTITSTLDSFYWEIDSVIYSQPKPKVTFTTEGWHVAKLYAYVNGCSRVYISNIHIDGNFPPSQFYTEIICPGDFVRLFAPSGGDSYMWWTPNYPVGDDTFASSVWVTTNITRMYYIKVIRDSACDYTDSILVKVDTTCVWPGDANSDNIADMFDLLSVGIAYGDTGYIRPNADTTWSGQYCQNWGNNFSNGENYKHADCNGDGIVDSLDVTPMAIHFGKTHTKSRGKQGQPGDPNLYFTFSQDSVEAGDTVRVTVNLGRDTNVVSSIYGIVFDLALNLEMIDAVTADFSNSWIGPKSKTISLSRFDVNTNSVYVGLSRIDQQNVSGYGPIGTLNIVLPDNIGGKAWVYDTLLIEPMKVKLIDASENDIPVFITDGSLKVYQTGIRELAPAPETKLRVYPNPVDQTLNMESTEVITEIRLVNLVGQQVLFEMPYEKIHTIDAQALPGGVYSVIVVTDKRTETVRVIKY